MKSLIARQNAPAERKLSVVGRLLAIAGAVVAPLFMDERFRPFQYIASAVWAGLPIPLGWWIGRKLARGTTALAVLVAILAVLWALATWLYWDAFLGPSSRTESLAGLIVLFAPLYQWIVIVVMLPIVWLIGRRARTRDAPEGP